MFLLKGFSLYLSFESKSVSLSLHWFEACLCCSVKILAGKQRERGREEEILVGAPVSIIA